MPVNARALAGLLLLAACGNPPVAGDDASPLDSADDADAVVAVDVVADATVAPADATAATCPNTAMQILEGLVVVPQTVLHLKCDVANGADIAKCVWNIAAPPGSTSQLQAGGGANDAVFTPNVAGTYTFCPFATYHNGVMDCAIPCQSVVVLPDQAVHGELLWDTPGAATLTDADPCTSAHPDVHFAHPLAAEPDQDCDGAPDPWFDLKYDCWGYTCGGGKILDWGSANPNVDDNPSLDDGAPGPWQDLNITSPEDGKVYSIGVQNTGTCGPTLATVRLYMYGTLAYEAAQSLKPFDMWFVGTLEWPSGDVSSCHHGDACKSKSGTGACITPCYKPPEELGIPGQWTSTACP